MKLNNEKKIKNLDTKYTYKPPSGEKWDFENRTHKAALYEIKVNSQGAWCQRCGTSHANLSLHHIRTRGRHPENMLMVDWYKQVVFYRDDPFNLVLLCSSCHSWVESHSNSSEVLDKWIINGIRYKEKPPK